MSYLSIILLLIRIADNLLSYVRTKQAMEAGADAEVAKAAASILLKTTVAKQVMQDVTGMTEDQIDKALKELEP